MFREQRPFNMRKIDWTRLSHFDNIKNLKYVQYHILFALHHIIFVVTKYLTYSGATAFVYGAEGDNDSITSQGSRGGRGREFARRVWTSETADLGFINYMVALHLQTVRQKTPSPSMGSRRSLESVPEDDKWDAEETGSIYARQRRGSSSQVSHNITTITRCDQSRSTSTSLKYLSRFRLPTLLTEVVMILGCRLLLLISFHQCSTCLPTMTILSPALNATLHRFSYRKSPEIRMVLDSDFFENRF